MTSSQEPQLTRRELRERERLQEQQVPLSNPDATPPSPAPPVNPPAAPVPTAPAAPTYAAPAAPTYAAPPAAPTYAAPAAPTHAAPGSAGSFGDHTSPFGGATAAPVQPNPFAPRRVDANTATPIPASSPPPRPAPAAAGPPAIEPTTPERTLTRRELRAMLDTTAGSPEDLDLGNEPAVSGKAPTPATAALPPTPQPAPVRAAAPHQVAESAIADESFAAPKPVGHWTAQLNSPVERAEPFDQFLSRGGVSRGVPTTTNALILPSLPDHGQVGNGLTNGSEVIVTGSIDLPRSYGATGVHPRQIDSSDVDRLFDQVEDSVGIGAPVAATRAISTQGAARTMMAPPQKEGMNVPLVLAVTAGILALGVVATLVIGAVSGLF